MSADVIFLVAEASHRCGLGHVMELRAVAEALCAKGAAARQIAVGEASAGVGGVEWVSDYATLLERIASSRPRVVGWSVRTDRWRGVWQTITGFAIRHLWITDIADDYPPVDVLVVPTLEPRWRPPLPGTRVLAGASYFPLDTRGRRGVPALRTRPRQVMLSLGGADPSEASLRLAPLLAGSDSTVVVGPLFRHRALLLRVAAEQGLDAVIAPDGLRDLLLAHRMVISSGGNTLFEAAAAGTPALVAWEDAHEQTLASAFAARGTAKVLGCGATLDLALAARTLRELLASDEPDAMSVAGPRVVDGRGADRMAELLVELAVGVHT